MATDDVPAPRPRARKPRKFRSDVFRANWSTLVTIVPAIATVMWLSATMPSGERSGLENVAVTYIIYWPLFTVVYLVWTHRAYSTRDRELLAAAARHETVRRRSWRAFLTGTAGPTDWTISAALIAVVVTVAIAVAPELRGSPLFIVLGLATVAGSWAVMVYSFALDYMRISLLQEDGAGGRPARPHLTFDFDGTPRFDDYLTFALMVSTMAVTAPARMTSRQAWRIVGRNVVMAFVFNTVIVAMMVSLLFGGLGG